MRLSASTLFSALLIGAASASASSHGLRHNKRHHDLAAREPEPLGEGVADAVTNATEHTHSKRGNYRFSFYDVGLGSCGQTNTADQYIVALNAEQYDSGSYCFQMITITYNGKSTSAQIMDRCPGCPYGGLDMSTGLFTFFASESEGIIYGDWTSGGGDSGGGTSSSSSTQWTSTSSTAWTPTTTWEAPTTTWSSSTSSTEETTWSSSSTWSSSWSSSSSSSWSSWSSSSSSSSSSTSTSTSSEATSASSYDLSSGGLAVSTGSGALPTGTSSENVYNLNLAIIEMGALINAGAAAN